MDINEVFRHLQSLQRKDEAGACLSYTPQETKALVLAAQAGDSEAINQLCISYAPLIMKLIRSGGAYRTLGEDSFSLAFIQLLELIYSYKDCDRWESFAGYLEKGLYYRLLDAQILQLKEPAMDSLNQEAEEDKPSAPEPSCHPIEDFQLNLELQQSLSLLSATERTAVEQYYCHGYTLEEIARRCHNNKSTISRNLERGMKKLKVSYNVLS